MLLTGRVQAHGGKVAIPFVNIRIRGKNTGTVADESGSFSLRVPLRLATDTLTFSAVGYEEQAVAIAQLTKHQTFSLQKKPRP